MIPSESTTVHILKLGGQAVDSLKISFPLAEIIDAHNKNSEQATSFINLIELLDVMEDQ